MSLSFSKLMRAISAIPAPAVFNEAVIAGATSVFASRRLISTSTKFAKVRRASQSEGSETDVLWDTDGTTRVSLLAKLGTATQLGQVVVLYDQTANAFDAAIPDLTSASYLKAPVILAGRAHAGYSQLPTAPILYDGLSQATPKRLNLPAGHTVTNNAFTVFKVHRRFNSSALGSEFEMGIGSNRIGFRTNKTPYQGVVGGTATNFNPRKPPAARWSVVAFVVDGNNVTITDEQGAQTYTLAQTGAAVTGGVISNDLGGNAGSVEEQHAMITMARVMTPTEVADVRTQLAAVFGIEKIVPPKNWIQVGESRLEGTGAIPAGKTITYITDDGLAGMAQSYNMGIFGEQFIPNGGTASKFTGDVLTSYKPGSVVAVLSFYNDLTAGAATGLACYNSLVTYCNTARTAGFKVAVFTAISGLPMTAPQLVEFQDLNARIRANWATFCDGIIDAESDPALSTTSGYSATYWAGDKIHLTTAGNAIVASYAIPVIRQLLA